MYPIQDLHISFYFFNKNMFDIGDKSMFQLFLSKTVDVQDYSITNWLIYFYYHEIEYP